MNPHCICPHTTCPMHGNCKVCTDYHKGKPYCKASRLRKAIYRLTFKIYDKSQLRKQAKNDKKRNTISHDNAF